MKKQQEESIFEVCINDGMNSETESKRKSSVPRVTFEESCEECCSTRSTPDLQENLSLGNSPEKLNGRKRFEQLNGRKTADLLIKIEDSLFPVHKTVISQYSVTLKNMIDTQVYDNDFFDDQDDDEDLPDQCICIKNSKAADVKALLDFMYHPEKVIGGKLRNFVMVDKSKYLPLFG